MIAIEVNITGNMKKVKVGIEIIEEDLVEIQKAMDLGIEVDPPLGIKVKKESVITVGNHAMSSESVKKERGSRLTRGQKACMKKILEVAVGN